MSQVAPHELTELKLSDAARLALLVLLAAASSIDGRLVAGRLPGRT